MGIYMYICTGYMDCTGDPVVMGRIEALEPQTANGTVRLYGGSCSKGLCPQQKIIST